MKRILVVLLFVAAASVGFSVTGQVYTELRDQNSSGAYGTTGGVGAIGFYTSEPWAAGGVTPLDDLRCGRQGTGVDLNFDTWTLTYKLRDVLYAATNANVGGVQGLDKLLATSPNPGVLSATSPGYLQFNGLKAGGLDFSIGISWWTVMSGTSTITTNGSATSTTNAANASYNLVAMDFTYGFNIGDVRIHGDPWDKIEVCGYSGASSSVSGANFNQSSAVNGVGYRIPINIDWSSGPLSISLPVKIMGDGQTYWQPGVYGNYQDLQIGAVAKINYTINDFFGVWIDVGLVDIGGGNMQTNAGTTNNYSGLLIPTTFGIKLTPAPVWTINLGYGYMFVANYTAISQNGAVGTTNSAGSLPDTMYDAYGCHGYDHPFMNLSIDTKFATDWTAGLRFIVYIDNPLGQEYAGGYEPAGGSQPGNGTGANNYLGNFTSGGSGTIGGVGSQQNTSAAKNGSVTYTTVNNWLYFTPEGDWDNFGGSSCYIGYSKDNFSVKLWTAAQTGFGINAYAISASQGLLGLFGAIDVSIKF